MRRPYYQRVAQRRSRLLQTKMIHEAVFHAALPLAQAYVSAMKKVWSRDASRTAIRNAR